MLTCSYLGVGIPQSAEHFERRMVSREEGQQITSTGHMVTQEWDAAWDEEEEEDPLPGTNRASVEEHRRVCNFFEQLSPYFE